MTSLEENKIATAEVENWWNKNPFTLGIVKNGDLVGRVDPGEMDLKYFEEVDRKFRKFHRTGCQEDNAPLLSKLINYDNIREKKVLDIAVGTGVTLVAFATAGAEVTGIDITDFAVMQTKKNLACRGLAADVIKMDAQRMSFPDESFDFVNAWGCLMHMPDTEKAICEIYRVLKPDGKVLAYMYNKSSWVFWFNFIFLRGILLGKLIKYRFDIDKLTSRYTDGAALGGNMLAKLYTPKQAANLFKKAGFNNVKSFPLVLPHEPDEWPMRKFPIFKFLPYKIKIWLAHYGLGLIVVGEK